MDNEIIETHIPSPRGQDIQSVTEFTVDQVVATINKVREIVARLMVENEDYGVIPGCKKKSVWQSGAEKLCMAFRLKPSYVVSPTDMENGHREYIAVCTLTHIPSGCIFGEGVASCSTMESKYRYRGEGRKCPACGAEAIIKGKDEFGGGWLCFKKKGGCGAKFKDGDAQIEQQEGGKVENPDIADTYNTVIQIACKRAYVKATRSATAASGIFTDTIGDPDDPQFNATPFPDRQNGGHTPPAKPPVQPPQRRSQAASGPADANTLAELCNDIAAAGYTVATENYKDFRLVLAAAPETGESICVKLSSFVGRDKNVVPGRAPADLSSKALGITTTKAKAAWDALQQVLSTRQDRPPVDGDSQADDGPLYWCTQCDQGFDTAKTRKINGQTCTCCPVCGTDAIMAYEDYQAQLASQVD